MALYARCLRVPGIIRNNTSQFFRPQSLKYPRLPIVNVSEDQSEAEVILPGFSYDDIDRIGRTSVWKLARMFEAVRGLPLLRCTGPSILDFMSIDKDVVIVVTAVRYNIYDPFYQKTHLYNPLRGCLYLERFGSTSITLDHRLYDFDSGDYLAQSLMTLVLVDRKKRKPCRIPDHLLQKLSGHCKEQYPPLKIPIMEMSEHCALVGTPSPPAHSDTNLYFHTSHAVYIRRCIDSVTEAALQNQLKGIQGDIANSKVTQVDAVYTLETAPGQQLVDYVWQDDVNPRRIYTSTFRGTELVFHQALQIAE